MCWCTFSLKLYEQSSKKGKRSPLKQRILLVNQIIWYHRIMSFQLYVHFQHFWEPQATWVQKHGCFCVHTQSIVNKQMIFFHNFKLKIGTRAGLFLRTFQLMILQLGRSLRRLTRDKSFKQQKCFKPQHNRQTLLTVVGK